MVSRIASLTLLAVLYIPSALASDVEGNIIIKRKLTKRRVTPAANSYDRGVAVELRSDQETDPLAFERERVVVYLEGENLPSKPLIANMEQRDRRFVPDTLWIPAGSSVAFPNLDPIFHNVFSLSKPKEFDLGNYPKDHSRTVTFAKPGIVFVNCHLHPNMAAAIVVSPNQWGARVDGTGKFTLPSVPPGTYTAVAWHRTAGYFRKTIQIVPNHNTPLEFFIPLGEDGAAAAGTEH
jgi:plastocyanin